MLICDALFCYLDLLFLLGLNIGADRLSHRLI